jgi:hypothetical protein
MKRLAYGVWILLQFNHLQLVADVSLVLLKFTATSGKILSMLLADTYIPNFVSNNHEENVKPCFANK